MNLDQTAVEADVLQEPHTTGEPRPDFQADAEPDTLEVGWEKVERRARELGLDVPTESGWLGEVLEMMASAYTPVAFYGSSPMEQLEELFFRGLLCAGVVVFSYWLASAWLAPGLF